MRLWSFDTYRRAWGLTALAATIIGSSTGAGAQTRTIRLDSGTVLPVTLDKTISSSDARRGDAFTATVRTDNDTSYDGLPSGTGVEGVVRDVRAQQGNNPGLLDLEFRRIRLPDGHSFPIQGSLIGLDTKSIKRTSDGRLIATPDHRDKKLVYAGYGAGAGLIVGLLTKHTLEDTLIGGGLGYLFGTLDKSHSNARDVTLKSGTELGVRLDRTVTTSDYDNTYNGDGSYRVNENGQYHRTGQNNGRLDNGLNRATDIGVLVGNENVNFDSNAPPVMTKGVVLIPAIPVLKSAGIAYTYSPSRRLISARGSGGTGRVTAGSRIAVVNGTRRVLLPEAAQWLNGTLYVPARFFALVTGQNVDWDASSRTIVINGTATESDNLNPNR